MAPFSIRPASASDVPAITAITNALLATTTIEWTDDPHSEADRRAWLIDHEERGFPVLVAEADGKVIAWAAYGDFSDSIQRPGYRFVVEHTIHVHEDHWGEGVGRALMLDLIAQARDAGLHAMVAAVDGANLASIRLHERLGFTEVGRLPEVGAKHGRWLDLVLLQLLLDDRPTPPG